MQMRWRMNVSRALALAACVMACAGCGHLRPMKESGFTGPATAEGDVVVKVASAEGEDALETGRAAALDLKAKLAGKAPKLVLLAECYEDARDKKRAIQGVASVLDRGSVFGLASYGSFSQSGCHVQDSVTLVGIAGSGVGVAYAVERGLGAAKVSSDQLGAQIDSRLTAAGRSLGAKLQRTGQDRLLIVMADAHSPKNAPLVRGVQAAVGKGFPITGGSANKNEGQTFVYYRGRMLKDSAVAVMLSGRLTVAMAGRQAKSSDKVIATAKESAGEALAKLGRRPVAAFVFDCAGRKGKLKNVADELASIQAALGKSVPLFGCYCAGEIGPADVKEKDPGVLSSGVGWHVMFTAIGQK